MYVPHLYRPFALKLSPATGGSNASIRVQPLPGQGVPAGMYVECSRSMREQMLAAGKVAILECMITNKEDGRDFLYAHFRKPFRLVTLSEAQALIRKKALGFPS